MSVRDLPFESWVLIVLLFVTIMLGGCAPMGDATECRIAGVGSVVTSEPGFRVWCDLVAENFDRAFAMAAEKNIFPPLGGITVIIHPGKNFTTPSNQLARGYYRAGYEDLGVGETMEGLLHEVLHVWEWHQQLYVEGDHAQWAERGWTALGEAFVPLAKRVHTWR